jgi:hypothetical protein
MFKNRLPRLTYSLGPGFSPLLVGSKFQPSTEAKCRGASDGNCALCGELEDWNHIFFSFPLAKFMWVEVRKLLHCFRNPAEADEFLVLSHGLSNSYRRLVRFTFMAQRWTLSNIRNKLAMEGSLIAKPADALYKILVYLHQRRMLVKSRDIDLLNAAMWEIRRLHSTLLS